MIRDGGSATMTPDELDEFLEGRAASIGTSTGGDSGSASMSALKADVPAVMQAFADVLRKPRFDADRLAIAMTGAQAGISRQNDDPHRHPLARVPAGDLRRNSPFARDMTYASLASHARRSRGVARQVPAPQSHHPRRVGDITVAEARALVTKAFGDWKKGPGRPSPRSSPSRAPSPSPGVFEVVKEDSRRRSSRATSGIAAAHDPDFYAVEVLNEVLSGGFTSRLFSNVRTAKGLAYNVGGSMGAAGCASRRSR